MDKFKEELETHTKLIMNLAKRSVVMDLMSEVLEHDYHTTAQFNVALANKLEELKDE